MNQRTQIIESLRKEAKSDKFAEAAFMVCAVRPRARYRVTMDSLKQRMTKEGYAFEDHQAARFLSVLAALDLGKLERDSKGRVVALTDIKTTLQSIGKAALGEGLSLDKFRKRRRYVKLAAVPKAVLTARLSDAVAEIKAATQNVDLKAEPASKRPEPLRQDTPVIRPAGPSKRSLVGLAVDLGGRTVRLPMPDELSSEEIAMIIERFREPKRA